MLEAVGKYQLKIRLQFIMFKRIVEELLATLSEKSEKILIARFGLDGQKPKTLEAIGKEFGITRERVRQIEVASFQKLKKSEKSESVLKIFKKAVAVIENQGYFLGVKGFEKKFFRGKVTLLQENRLKIILNSCQDFSYVKTTSKMNGFWYLQKEEVNPKIINNLHKCLLDYFKNIGEPVGLTKIVRDFEKADFCREEEYNFLFNKGLTKNIIKTILQNSKLIEANILDEWGLASWKLIKANGLKERSYLIFKKYQKPLHFRELTELINKHFTSQRVALPETVCNVVIYFDDFVAVESGIYAPSEWKIFDEELKNEIVLFLENKNKKAGKNIFVDRDEIIKYIREKRGDDIKTFVIQANLFDKNLFSRRGKGYTLK